MSRERGADCSGVAAGLASRLIRSNTGATAGGASGALRLRAWCTPAWAGAAAAAAAALELRGQREMQVNRARAGNTMQDEGTSSCFALVKGEDIPVKHCY